MKGQLVWVQAGQVTSRPLVDEGSQGPSALRCGLGTAPWQGNSFCGQKRQRLPKLRVLALLLACFGPGTTLGSRLARCLVFVGRELRHAPEQ